LGRAGGRDGLGKNGKAFDMQEPFRFVIDLAIIDLIENDKMEKKCSVEIILQNRMFRRPKDLRYIVSLPECVLKKQGDN